MNEVGEYAVLRVRPPEIAASGWPRERLTRFAKLALGVNDAGRAAGKVHTFQIPTDAVLDPFDDDLIDRLSDWIHQAASSVDVVVLDLNFDPNQVRFASIEQLFLGVARNIAPVWQAGTRLVVFIERVPDEEDDFAGLVGLEGLEGSAMFLDVHGEVVGDATTGWTDPGELVTAVAPSTAERLATALTRALRRRGVFRVATSRRNEYAAFKYSVDPGDLADLLASYLTASGFDLVIFDDLSAPWLFEAVQSVKDDSAKLIRRFSTADLQPGRSRTDNRYREMLQVATAKVADQTNRMCLVVPMIKHGNRIDDLLQTIENLGRTDVTVLTVFLAAEHGQVIHTPADGKWSNRVVLDAWDEEDLGQPGLTVDYFFDVNHHRLGASSWQVAMASSFGEDFEDSDPKWKPSIAGLWMLLNEYQERSHYESARHPVLLQLDLDDWDASWLAASLMRTLEDRVPWPLNDLVVVYPDEETAIRPVMRSLEKRQDVRVLPIPREAVNGDVAVSRATLRTLRRFHKNKIVIMDESTSTYGTLERLSKIIWDEIDRGPDLCMTILDLPEPGAVHPDNLVSVYGWRPLRRSDDGRSV